MASSLGNFGWGLSLGFSLAAAGLISIALLKFSPRRTFQVEAENQQVRTFKGQAVDIPVRLRSLIGVSQGGLALVKGPEGITADLQQSSDGAQRLRVHSNLSGVFRGFRVKLAIPDFLAIVERYEERELDLSVEFLPKSLLSQVATGSMTPLTLGELPANTRGLAQEFYGAERYNLSQDVKDILWKRLARLSTEPPMVRVREANVPELVTIYVLELHERAGPEWAHWMDLTCEAVALLGRAITGMGMRLRVAYITRAGRRVVEAHDLESLADCTMKLWQPGASEAVEEGTAPASILLTGERELMTKEAFGLGSNRPTVILSLEKSLQQSDSGFYFFTGKEDLSGLVGLALSR